MSKPSFLRSFVNVASLAALLLFAICAVAILLINPPLSWLAFAFILSSASAFILTLILIVSKSKLTEEKYATEEELRTTKDNLKFAENKNTALSKSEAGLKEEITREKTEFEELRKNKETLISLTTEVEKYREKQEKQLSIIKKIRIAISTKEDEDKLEVEEFLQLLLDTPGFDGVKDLQDSPSLASTPIQQHHTDKQTPSSFARIVAGMKRLSMVKPQSLEKKSGVTTSSENDESTKDEGKRYLKSMSSTDGSDDSNGDEAKNNQKKFFIVQQQKKDTPVGENSNIKTRQRSLSLV